MVEIDDQALTVYTRKNFKKKERKENFNHNKKKEKKPKNTKRGISNVQCYTCDEKGHLERDCPVHKRRHHAHIVEDDEPTSKRLKQEKNDLDEEYVLISALTGIISHGSNGWLVGNGACKHTMGY